MSKSIKSELTKDMRSEALKDMVAAQELLKSNPVFSRFVFGLVRLLKDENLAPEEVLTGCALAVGEYEFHIEPDNKWQS